MSDEYNVAPVNHSALSTAGSVATGAIGGAAKSFGKTMLWSIGICAALGAAFAASFFTAGVSTGLVAAVAAGGVGGGLLGLLPGSFLGGFTGIFGAGKGALDAKDRVSMEKGQAFAMERQLAAYQAMAASNDRNYNLPPQGSRMNPAMSQIDASSADRSGTVIGQQLARA